MNKRLAYLFPGQGSQYPRMGLDVYSGSYAAKKVFEHANDVLGFSLSQLIFEGTSEVLTLTKNSQIAIFVTSMALLSVLQERCPSLHPAVCAGLSLGEYTALCAAGRISFEDCLKLVRIRGEAMQMASERHPGGLSAVLGMESSDVEKLIQQMEDEVWVANLNCPKQVVISGSHEGLKKAEILLKAHGAKRVISLDVSGAFHSGLMKEAQDVLKTAINEVSFLDSPVKVVMNVPGDFVEAISQIKENLIWQVVSPTRWEQGMRQIEKNFPVAAYIEVGCGTTLAGMNKKIGVTAPTFNMEKLEDLELIEKALVREMT